MRPRPAAPVRPRSRRDGRAGDRARRAPRRRGERPERPRPATRARRSRRQASSHCAPPRSVLPGDEAMPDARVDDHQFDTRAAAARGRTCSDLVSRNSAAPAVPRLTTIWSMMPVGAPTNSFSAHFPAIASSTSSRRRSKAARSARADAHLERGARGQPAADRHRRLDPHVDATQVETRACRSAHGRRPARNPATCGSTASRPSTNCSMRRASSTLALHTRTLASGRGTSSTRVRWGITVGSTKPPL